MVGNKLLFAACLACSLGVDYCVAVKDVFAFPPEVSPESRQMKSLGFVRDENGQWKRKVPLKPLPESNAPTPSAAEVLGLNPLLKADRECGANSLYVLLRLNHIDVSLAELRSALPKRDSGASMLELKTLASQHGYPCEVVDLAPDRLVGHLPVVARIGDRLARDEGHFVVVTHISESQVYLVDGTTGMSESWPRSLFDQRFSGYALWADRPSFVSIAKYVAAIAFVVCVSFCLLVWRQSRLQRLTAPSTSSSLSV